MRILHSLRTLKTLETWILGYHYLFHVYIFYYVVLKITNQGFNQEFMGEEKLHTASMCDNLQNVDITCKYILYILENQ